MAASDDEAGGQSLYAEDETANADPNEFDQRPAECAPTGPTPSFELVSEFFELLQDMRGKRTAGGNKGSAEKKRALVQQMFARWRTEVGKDLYPLVRLLVPDRDRYRATYGTKEQVLAKIYIQVLSLAKTSPSADRLLRWKQPTRDSKASGDFAEVAFSEIASRSTVERSKMTIEEVNDLLDTLSKSTKIEAKIKVVSTFHEKLTAKEQKWLIRVILKDLKISLGEKMVLACIHQDAIDLFNVCSDLRAVCWKLWDTSKRLPNEDNTVQLFRAFRPMLCNRNKNDFEDIAKTMGATGKNPRTFLIEEKLDGERIQLHKKGEEYRYYSRKDKDYTYLYGLDRTQAEAALTPFIHECFHKSIDEIILDGEMVVREPTTGMYLPFGNLKTTAINQFKSEGGPTVTYKVFDVLYAKGKGRPGRSLLDETLAERRKVMQKLITAKYARLEFADASTGHSAKDIKDRLAWILDKQGEGLVVKNLESVYTLHGREDDWIKVKPEYMDSLGEEVDVLVMGGFWGSGKRGGTLGSFMCGVLDDSDPDKPKYLSFCKVGSGFNMDDFSKIQEHVSGKGRDWVKGMTDPPGYVFGDEKPDVWFEPADSFIVAVKAAEITADAMNYGAEVCLRFPRMHKIRWDLGPSDCHKFQVDFLTMASSQRGEKSIADSFMKKRRVIARNPKASILPSLQGAKLGDLKAETNIFEGDLFYVVEGLRVNGVEVPESNKQALEKAIVSNGGKRWQSVPKGQECYVICGRKDFMKVKNIIKLGRDILHPSWIIDSVMSGQKVPLTARYYVHKSDDTTADQPNDDGAQSDSASPPSSSTGPSDKRAKLESGTVQTQTGSAIEDSATETEEEDASTASDSPQPSGPAGKKSLFRAASPDIVKSEEEDLDAKITQSGMGAFTDAKAYDEQQIFRHLTFYLDTSANAEKNRVQEVVGTSTFRVNVAANDRRLIEAGKILEAGGGKLTSNLDEPALTHIIMSDDTKRFVDLSRRTREPRARRIVTVNWVEDSAEQEDLQKETWYQTYAA